MGLLFLITSDLRAASLCTLKLIISLIKLPYNGRSSGADLPPRVIITNKNLDGVRAGERAAAQRVILKGRPRRTGIKMGVAPVNDGTTDARERLGLLKETKLQARAKKGRTSPEGTHRCRHFVISRYIRRVFIYVKSKHRHKSCAAPPN
jgi:hypothetical protein